MAKEVCEKFWTALSIVNNSGASDVKLVVNPSEVLYCQGAPKVWGMRQLYLYYQRDGLFMFNSINRWLTSMSAA